MKTGLIVNLCCSCRTDRGGETPGLRFSEKVLHLLSHEQLLSLLNQLLRLSPALLSPDIALYLAEAGVDEALFSNFRSSGSGGFHSGNTAVGIRSPNRRMISSLNSQHMRGEGSPLRRASAQHRSSSSFNSTAASLSTAASNQVSEMDAAGVTPERKLRRGEEQEEM